MRTGRAELLLGWGSRGHTASTSMWLGPRSLQWPGWVPTGHSALLLVLLALNSHEG